MTTTWRACGKLYHGRDRVLVGIETVAAEPGIVTNRVVLREEHLNYNHVSTGASSRA